MKLIIHDLQKEEFETLGLNPEDATIISDNGTIKKCIGCFGCWVKTPGQCIIADDYQKMGELAGQAEELIIISKCSFGSYSSFVKNVLDRSISYILPYFTMRNGEMHHKSRYENRIKLSVYFYGDDITEEERETAKKLAEANGENLNCSEVKVAFAQNVKELLEVITW